MDASWAEAALSRYHAPHGRSTLWPRRQCDQARSSGRPADWLVATQVKGTMMRHSREQRTAADDEPLVPLPPLSTRWVGVDAPANAPET